MRNLKFVIFIMLLMILTPVSLAQTKTPVQCGDIIEGEFTQNEQPRLYSIELSAGDSLNTSAVPLGTTLKIAMGLYAPNDGIVWVGGDRDYYRLYPISTPEMNTDILSANGSYTILLYNDTMFNERGISGFDYNGRPAGVGVYTLFIGCTLRDGKVIEPGESVGEDSSNDVSPAPSAFTGFGFPGLTSVDFSDGIELPLSLGQAQTAPVASDVALYTYDAVNNEIATLSLSRVSGDISIGVTVINKDTNEILFLGGMPSSNNLSVELTFPSAGTYAIGLFRLDTAERTDTAGAVQITLE